MQNLVSQISTKRPFILIVGAWLFLSLAQTLHYFLYYEQSLWNSIYWSFRDWLVWFAVFALLFCIGSRHRFLFDSSIKSLFLVAIMAIVSGALQIIIINSISNLVGTSTRPFWVDVNRLYAKRWLQHLFTFFLFWLLLKNHFSKNSVVVEGSVVKGSGIERLSLDDADIPAKIKVNDGKQTHWLRTTNIISLEAAGNYVCFHTELGQIISRETLKAIENQLSEPAFLRVSRSHIVNTAAIERSARVSRSKIHLELKNGSSVPIGPSYWQHVKEFLDL